MNNIIRNALREWIPYKMIDHSNDVLFDWLYTGNETYTEPFFDATIGKCLQYRRTSRPNKHISTAEALIEWSECTDHIKPTAFIFHVSRCGSTLLSQALAVKKEFVSLSEVPVFDSILRLSYQRPDFSIERTGKLLKAASSFYGSKRSGLEEELFIKTDSWHLMFYRQLRSLYPGIPFFVLYRNPEEVLQSNRHRRGMQACYNLIEPGLFGLADISDEQTHPDIYMPLVLEKYFEAIIDNANDPDTILLNYNQGLMCHIETLKAVAGLNISNEYMEAVSRRGKYNAKYPEEPFSERLPLASVFDTPMSKLNALYKETENLRIKAQRLIG
jgi:hypothetical protein